ncbi:ABC transporter ATP-binding protein [Burkholderia sp. L27(2015)]|uniref:ABC transporter ATP-binding protein n=1 Tax=Burkholderia sp. L27(2015) TaxID=1641858 RepID=UPI00131CA06F|nr:ABC transporter ATP-binding protein [Burkholderia sp. L27(2015)]
MLSVDNISMRFMGLTALDGVSFTVKQGEVHALIGPNGAGKTTLFNIISGVQKPSSGTVSFEPFGDLAKIPLGLRSGLGMMRTFQNIRLFGSMSVLENVLLGATCLRRGGVLGAAIGSPAARREEHSVVAAAYALLERVGLADAALAPALSLSYGAQRRLEIARALAGEPRLLMLDEPAAGMNDAERETLADLISSIRDQGIAILVVEHDMPFINKLSDRITVLNFGKRIASGSPYEICRNPAVIEAYLGSEHRDTEHA